MKIELSRVVEPHRGCNE